MSKKWFTFVSLGLTAEVFIIWGSGLWDDGELVGLTLLFLLPIVALGIAASLLERERVCLLGGIAGLFGLLLWTYHLSVTIGLHPITFAVFRLPFIALTVGVILSSLR